MGWGRGEEGRRMWKGGGTVGEAEELATALPLWKERKRWV